MRHANHRFILGVSKAHRLALMSNLAAALFRHGRIETTLTKAKALRPFAEKMITLAKRAHLSQDPAQKVHFRRLVLTQVRDKEAVKQLFNERTQEFINRAGGYTRIFKLLPRIGDAADMALIELIQADDQGFQSRSRRQKATTKKAAARKRATKAKAASSDAQADELAPAESGSVLEEESAEAVQS